MTSARRPPPPFDLVILTGFLGAGKTSLLNRLLREPGLDDTLVLINEFGEVGLDHLLVESVDGDTVLMASGCVCCSIRGELVETLEDILRRRDNDRMRPFTRLILETTGLADPAPVLHSIMTHPYLRLRFRLKAVATLVDAVNGMATLDGHREAVRQVALADRVFLTKLDLLPDVVAALPLRERLARLNPAAPVIDLPREGAVAPLLFDARSYDPAERGADAAAWLAAEALDDRDDAHDHHAHHHDHDPHDHEARDHEGHDHDAHIHDAHIRDPRGHHSHAALDPNRHGERISAFCLRFDRPVQPPAVTLFLELLRAAHGARLLRLKGLVATSDDPDRPLVVHAVQHALHPPQRLDAWPDADRGTRLVFIVEDLDRDYIESVWRAAAGEPLVDEADARARLDNPLKPSPGGLLG